MLLYSTTKLISLLKKKMARHVIDRLDGIPEKNQKRFPDWSEIRQTKAKWSQHRYERNQREICSLHFTHLYLMDDNAI